MILTINILVNKIFVDRIIKAEYNECKKKQKKKSNEQKIHKED